MNGQAHVLAPAGEGARAIANLTWWFIGLSAVVFLVVLVLLVVAARKTPQQNPSEETDRRSIRWIVLGGAVIPAVILVALFVPTLLTLNRLAAVPPEDGLVIEVIGKRWWWEVVYRDGSNPQRAVVSANELHLPTGVRVPLVLTSTDVIHSFWVPGLQGKLDLVPGRENRMWLQADEPGVYRGACAEYCGLQHARMGILVVAHEPAEFAAWLERHEGEAQPEGAAAGHAAHGHGTMEGRGIFEQKACGLCHTIRGTAARGRVGPDLTHFGSRLTIAAGMLENNRGNLAGWIANPQALKPGANMPAVPLAPDELNALVNYLLSLE